MQAVTREPPGDAVHGALEGALAVEEARDVEFVLAGHQGDRAAGGGDLGLDEVVQHLGDVPGEDLLAGGGGPGRLEDLVQARLAGGRRAAVP
ncbi:hypothetical protein [Spongiactinospora sp. TRM90649]|uniref:hypothetical protein n=1 Tax=Spongiactinospora sp. TRM90649 TaxID=3031114 RepID=UPI0023FA0BF3|nr:hypothetical protein [Spongiactinospora sp. TRM90649]MDF5752037.1 hypothetical protein [Spongiactinospora sp. TRM90649]